MLTNHQITAFIVGILLPMTLFLARSSGKTFGRALGEADGFDRGYQAGLREQSEYIAALQEDIGRHIRANQAQAAAHQLERDTIIQDADDRIAIYARRAAPATAADLITLDKAAQTLQLAARSWRALSAHSSANKAEEHLAKLLDIRCRVQESLSAGDELPQDRVA